MLIHKQILGVEKALDALSLRFQVEAQNLANVNTPHYVPSEVNFEDSLKQAMASAETQPSALPDGMEGQAPSTSAILNAWHPTVTQDPSDHAQRIDGNGTSVEQAMSAVVQTEAKYTTLTEVVAKEYVNLKYVADQR